MPPQALRGGGCDVMFSLRPVFPMSPANIGIFYFASHEYWLDLDEICLIIFWAKFYLGQENRLRQKIRIDVKPLLPPNEWHHTHAVVEVSYDRGGL